MAKKSKYEMYLRVGFKSTIGSLIYSIFYIIFSIMGLLVVNILHLSISENYFLMVIFLFLLAIVFFIVMMMAQGLILNKLWGWK